jgi:hypothetical protein
MKWEYKLVRVSGQLNESSFNKLGEAGWELVGITYDVSNGVFILSVATMFIFKRPKVER